MSTNADINMANVDLIVIMYKYYVSIKYIIYIYIFFIKIYDIIHYIINCNVKCKT